MTEPRDRETRKLDSLAMLATPAIDVWVATASVDGEPYLVPLSLAWLDERVVLAVEGSSRTARNLTETEAARVALGPTRDVVVMDTVLERSVAVADDPALGAAYVTQADWDPRDSSGYVFLALRPIRLQAWRNVAETRGRTLMRDGAWLV